MPGKSKNYTHANQMIYSQLSNLPLKDVAVNKAEFDRFADEYYAQLAAKITASGEHPEFFAEYKIADSARLAKEQGIHITSILDFGSGIGNSIPWFRKYFDNSKLICADVSTRSLELAKQRFPGRETYLEISGESLDLPDCSVDLAFSACVFHHIPHHEHITWLTELRRVLRPGGLLVIFEHNPLNPLTVATVRSCPFDENACLIKASKLRQLATLSGWKELKTRYRIFFPHALATLRPLERLLHGVGLGAQYYIFARKL